MKLTLGCCFIFWLLHAKSKYVVSIQFPNDRAPSVDTVSLIRSISIRPFASKNVSQLFVLEDFNVTETPRSNSQYRY